MNGRDLLRQYLEQRRELGESEFVLDSLTVADAMRALGARGDTAAPAAPVARDRAPSAPATPPAAPPAPSMRARPEEDDGGTTDWRSALRAAGATPPPKTRTEVPAAPVTAGPAPAELPGGPLAGVSTIDAIARLVAECRACPLYATALNPVPGEGNPNADFVCVGEAPGATEDETGRPFIGRAGDLLTKILAAVNLKREDVFICNVLKHRPPGNRNPAPDEIVACRPYLLRQLELIKPKVVLALGTFAAQTLLDSKLPIGKLRGQVHSYYGIPLVVTYHPAALLRNPGWKRPTWEDVQLARRILDGRSDGA